MATNFPASLDTLTNPSATDTLDSPPHDEQHADANDAIEALQAKVGVDSSAVTTSLDYKVAQLEAVSHGKILQVVRATDSSFRSTSSTSYVDASISVTITPTSASSDVMLIWSANKNNNSGSAELGFFQITDSSNVAISGAEEHLVGTGGIDNTFATFTIIGYDSPATTSATTYKGRFKAYTGGTLTQINNNAVGQLFALEISA
jgi:hypothetical protein